MYVCRYFHKLAAPVAELAALFKALSEPARLSIVLALSDECRPVSDVVDGHRPAAAAGVAPPAHPA